MSLSGTTIENTPEAWTERAAAPTSWGAAGWSEHGQTARMRAIIDALDPRPGERLLDYGCGSGRLVDFIGNPDVCYVGFDPSPGMVERAQRDHSGFAFQTWEPTLSAFDLVAIVGPFNLSDRWSKQLTWATLRRLWDSTSRTLAASLYAGDDERCLTYTEEEITRFATSESYRWRVERHLPNDLLLVLER